MAKGQRSGKQSIERLARLRRRPEQVIEGGKQVLPLYFYENRQTFQPYVSIWLDASDGRLLASDVINPLESKDEGVSEALEVLALAMAEPEAEPQEPQGRTKGGLTLLSASGQKLGSSAGLPGRVRVNDETLAQAARKLLEPLNVQVDYMAEIPAFNEAFESLAEYMGADGSLEPPQPFTWEIDPKLVPPLFAAAASYYRRSPWEYLGDEPPVMVHLGAHGPQEGTETVYVSVLGGAGAVLGAVVYYSLEAMQRMAERGQELLPGEEEIDEAIEVMRQTGAPIQEIPPDQLRLLVGQMLAEQGPIGEKLAEMVEDGLVGFFDPADERDPTYLDWLDDHKIKYSRQAVPMFLRIVAGGKAQPPNAREAQALTLVFEALSQFFAQHRRTLERGMFPEEGLKHEALVDLAGQRVPVEVSFPPEGYELVFEEDEEEFEEGGLPGEDEDEE
jgi:hypothetical protein